MLLDKFKEGETDLQELFCPTDKKAERRAVEWLDAQFKKARISGKPHALCNVLLTPVLAEVCLRYNDRNRDLRGRRVDTYAKSQTEGRWVEGVETIKFLKPSPVVERLSNGQHTCNAVIKSGKMALVDFRFGGVPESMLVEDTGAQRSSADAFGFRGEKNKNELSLATKLLHGYLHGHRATLDNDVVCEYMLKDHPNLRNSISTGNKAYRKLKKIGKCFPGPFAVAHYLICSAADWKEEDVADVGIWFENVSDGVGFQSKKNPAWALRQLILEKTIAEMRTSHFNRCRMMIGAIILAWNARVLGKSVTSKQMFDLVSQPGAALPTVEPWSLQ
jgi:hypothetical protein